MTTRLPRPVLRGCRGGVVAAHPLAVTAGDDVLRLGGNAVDAAVAAATALAVVAPDQCGLGGDALLLVREADGAVTAYVGAAALPQRPILPVTTHGPASAGVPGSVAAVRRARQASGAWRSPTSSGRPRTSRSPGSRCRAGWPGRATGASAASATARPAGRC